jgi:hypothetical protein
VEDQLIIVFLVSPLPDYRGSGPPSNYVFFSALSLSRIPRSSPCHKPMSFLDKGTISESEGSTHTDIEKRGVADPSFAGLRVQHVEDLKDRNNAVQEVRSGGYWAPLSMEKRDMEADIAMFGHSDPHGGFEDRWTD